MRDIDERVARRVRTHELGLIRFLTPRARRSLGDVEQDLGALRHGKYGHIGWSDFDTRFLVAGPRAPLEQALRELGAPDTCYVMAWLPEFGGPHPLDGQLVPLGHAIAELVDVTEAILSFVPGELVHVQEDPVISYYRTGIFKRHPRN